MLAYFSENVFFHNSVYPEFNLHLLFVHMKYLILLHTTQVNNAFRPLWLAKSFLITADKPQKRSKMTFAVETVSEVLETVS